jgi:hypothetical protein
MTANYGIVKDGRIEPDEPLPDGAVVEIRVVAGPGEFTPDEREEFEAWQQLSARAWENLERTMEEEEKTDAPR